MSTKLAINITERVNIRGGGKDAAFWNHVKERFSKEALRTKHLVGEERDKFLKELVKRRDALTKLEKALERCKKKIAKANPIDLSARAALIKERDKLYYRVKRARKRYIEYQNKSIELNFRFILKNAARYSVSVPPHKFDDLIQECVMGWQRGLRTYDPAKGQLTTHGSFWIYQAVHRYVFNDSLIRIPHYLFEELNRMHRYGEDIPEKGASYLRGEYPSWSDEDVKKHFFQARQLTTKSNYCSLHMNVFDDDHSVKFEDLLVDSDAIDPEDLVNTAEMGDVVRTVLDSLESDRERDIVVRRFGLNGRDDRETLDSIAEDYGLTRERVRQIESRALEKIRININNGRLQIRASKSVRLRVIQGGGE